MRLALDGGLDDGGVVGVRDEGDNEVVGGDGLLEGGGGLDVQRGGSGGREAFSELLRVGNRARS
jgi:hypothetical protein